MIETPSHMPLSTTLSSSYMSILMKLPSIKSTVCFRPPNASEDDPPSNMPFSSHQTGPQVCNKGEIPIDSVEAKRYDADHKGRMVESTGIELRGGDKEMVSLSYNLA